MINRSATPVRTWLLTLATAVLLAASGAWTAIAADTDIGTTRFEGTVRDASGLPVAGYRLVVRVHDGPSVYVGPPADAAGHYVLLLPSGGSYDVVAVIAPDGNRVSLPESAPISAEGGTSKLDIGLPSDHVPGPRRVAKVLGSLDRLFLSFVEDPALVDHIYVEFGLQAADFDPGDRRGVQALLAVQFPDVPRAEVGARVGWADHERFGGFLDGSGATDLELWGKLRILRSANERTEVGAGALLTLPTGDDADGLGHDAFQSKLFVTASTTVASAEVVAHAGVRTTEDGMVGSIPVDGRVTATAGAGFLVPFSPRLSVAIEASYEGGRFEPLDSESRVLGGVNWRPGKRGMFRGALAAGLGDAAPEFELFAAYALEF